MYTYIAVVLTTCTRTGSSAPVSSQPSSCSKPSSKSQISTRAQVSDKLLSPRSPPQRASASDYRRIPRALSKVYYDPLDEENTREVEKQFQSYATADDPVVRNRALDIWGRKLYVAESTKKVAKFKFQDLCGKPLSAADYLEVTKNFGTVFITDIPKMDLGQKDLVWASISSAPWRFLILLAFVGPEVHHLY